MATNILFNSPRLRFSRAQQEAVLRWAKDLGANVPTLYSLNKFQQSALEKMGDPTIHVKAVSGNVFHMNNIANILAKVSIV